MKLGNMLIPWLPLTPKPQKDILQFLPWTDWFRMQIPKPFLSIPLHWLTKGSHTNIIMLNFKEIYTILKSLDMLFNYKVEKFSIKYGKVFIILRRIIMKGMRQLKWYVSILDIIGFKIMYRRYYISLYLMRLTNLIIDIELFRWRILFKISYARRKCI